MIKYVFVLFLFLTNCNYVCPDKTTVNIGTTEVDADNDNKNKTIIMEVVIIFLSNII